MDNATDNKPIFCAFCGSESLDVCSEHERGTATFFGRKFYYVFCGGCDACGPCEYEKEKAVETWNNRMTEPREPNGGHSPYDEWRTGADV